MKNNEVSTQFDSVMPGTFVLSVQMHPAYDATAEVRLMANGMYQIWHHYGAGSIPWADEIAAPTPRLEQAVAIVRDYQGAFTSGQRKATVARAARRMHISPN
jgi:hypothetical protein